MSARSDDPERLLLGARQVKPPFVQKAGQRGSGSPPPDVDVSLVPASRRSILERTALTIIRSAGNRELGFFRRHYFVCPPELSQNVACHIFYFLGHDWLFAAI